MVNPSLLIQLTVTISECCSQVESCARVRHATLLLLTRVYKRLQSTIGRNASQYTVNKQTYIHSLYINTKTYQRPSL